jgi:hypothetical protein
MRVRGERSLGMNFLKNGYRQNLEVVDELASIEEFHHP